ncbi:MAG: hypothetical protein OXG79_11035 [Chloroflexi bacterium]|nr:hypothetical protein [Chloroflexota bacterium]MCY4111550.1 hypothetical protein [Chloroflexota bacterium]
MLTLRAQAKSLSPELWRAIGAGVAVAVLFFVVVGLVTGAIDTPVLERQTPLLAIDYPIWVVNAALLGALSGLSVYARSRRITQSGTAIYSGGFLAAFAVSCPLCNGLLVAVFGTAGVLNVIEPARPFINVATMLILTALLVRRWRTFRADCASCEVEPAAATEMPQA